MPFTILQQPAGGGLEAYPVNMPDCLAVAILDGPEEREGRTTAILVYGFRYTHPSSEAQIEVPAGYITDFASIPAAIRGMFPPFGRHAKAAVLHDWLYLVGEPGKRAFADRIFLDAMEELGVSAFRRGVMHRAVRVGGGGGYAREQNGWSKAFGDWRTGDRVTPATAAADHYHTRWAKPPRADYRP